VSNYQVFMKALNYNFSCFVC